MALDPSMRASDSDRESVIARLRDGHAEGRLTMEEFESRLDATYAARTLAELVPITRDLPEGTPAEAAALAARRPGQKSPARVRRGPLWVSLFVCTAVVAGVSLITGEWPSYILFAFALPWVGLLVAYSLGYLRDESELPRRPGRQPGERDHR